MCTHGQHTSFTKDTIITNSPRCLLPTVTSKWHTQHELYPTAPPHELPDRLTPTLFIIVVIIIIIILRNSKPSTLRIFHAF